MSYSLIKGYFFIHYPENPLNGPEPDGDTIKFQPDNRKFIGELPRPGRPPKFTKNGITTLRFEGIDALETHFIIEGESFHQKMDLALEARDALIRQTGFGEVAYFDEAPFKVKSVENHPIRGYILSNGLDTYGRAVAFVFTGESSFMDGSKIFATPEILRNSLNAFMLEQGQAYPAFYLSLPADLRVYLREVTAKAQKNETGLWRHATATTQKWAHVAGTDELQELVIWPKLFRRLAAFYQDGHSSIADLDAWMREDPRDRDDRVILPGMELGNMHDVIIVEGSNIYLKYSPEEIVIVPDDYILPIPVDPPAPQDRSAGIRIIAALVNPKEVPERGNESVTLLNPTDQDMDLEGWFIADSTGRQGLGGILPKGDCLKVKLGTKVQLNNTRDTITLLNPQGGIVHQVSYEPRDLPREGYTVVF